MSDLTSVPRPHPENIAALADFAEIECLRCADQNVSVIDVARIVERQHGDQQVEAVLQLVHEAFGELTDRSRHCGPKDGRYPFSVTNQGSLLEFDGTPAEGKPDPSVYIYLLLATRMNMKSERHQGGEDATALFEHLCCEVAVRYWGGPTDQVSAVVFGTGRPSKHRDNTEVIDRLGFMERVNELCRQLSEGFEFHTEPGSRVTARDGKLDIVVWRRFADGRPGQLIGFGQCKTGTNWTDDLIQLQPDAFCAKWMRRRPAVPPVRLYFVSDRVKNQWYERCVDGGILFDRCRIMEHATDLPTALVARLGRWTRAAASLHGLAVP